jgi:hypothetical protein
VEELAPSGGRKTVTTSLLISNQSRTQEGENEALRRIDLRLMLRLVFHCA